MPHGIDPTMNQVQRGSFDATTDCSPPNTQRQQLMPSHNPMLRLRQLCKNPIQVTSALPPRTRFTFGPCEGLNVNLVRREDPGRHSTRHDRRR
jgi:hypothetical protein